MFIELPQYIGKRIKILNPYRIINISNGLIRRSLLKLHADFSNSTDG